MRRQPDYDRVKQALSKIDSLSAGLFTVGELDVIATVREKFESYPPPLPPFDRRTLAECLEGILARVHPE